MSLPFSERIAYWAIFWMSTVMMTAFASGDFGTLVESLTSEVGHENFTYYTLSQAAVPHHRTLVVLTSQSGDADLYISDKVKQPTYVEYDMKSTTCGDDYLDVTEMRRPVYIGVYGNNPFEVNRYTLQIFRQRSATIDHFREAEYAYDYQELPAGYQQASGKYYSNTANRQDKVDYDDDDEKEEFSLLNLLLNILDVIFKILLEMML